MARGSGSALGGSTGSGWGGRGVELRSQVSERAVRGRGSRWRRCKAKGFLSPARKRVLTRSGSLSGFDLAR